MPSCLAARRQLAQMLSAPYSLAAPTLALHRRFHIIGPTVKLPLDVLGRKMQARAGLLIISMRRHSL